MADLLVGFNLASGLVAKHLLHEVELLHQVAHVGVLNEPGVGGLTPHLVLVDGFHCCWQQWMEQQLHANKRNDFMIATLYFPVRRSVGNSIDLLFIRR